MKAFRTSELFEGVNAETKVLTVLQNLFFWEERLFDKIENEVLPKCGHGRVQEHSDFHKSWNVSSSHISMGTATSFPHSAHDSVTLVLNSCIMFLWASNHQLWRGSALHNSIRKLLGMAQRSFAKTSAAFLAQLWLQSGVCLPGCVKEESDSSSPSCRTKPAGACRSNRKWKTDIYFFLHSSNYLINKSPSADILRIF